MNAETATTVITAAALLTLLALSAFFSAAETSFTSITKPDYRKLSKSGNRRDRRIVALLSSQAKLLTAFLVGNNVVNILASSLATAFAINVAGNDGIGIATAAMTVAIVVFSEITPKTIAAENPVAVARALSFGALLARKATAPLVRFFDAVNSLFLSAFRRLMPSSSKRLSEDEVRTMMEVGRREGALEKDEHALLDRAFGFTDVTIREIMTPRTAMAAIPTGASLSETLEAFRASRFSRLPVYESSIDDIKGMIHYKDILFLDAESDAADISALMRPVAFVPETQTVTGLLGELKRKGCNLAIAIDEHGSTAGLATLDDAIASVFGSIRDEYDEGSLAPSELVTVFSSAHIRVPGNLRLADLNAYLRTSVDSEYFETVGGFVLERAGRLPAPGEKIRVGNLDFISTEVADRQIRKIDIYVRPEAEYGILKA
jgi:putative hemolysin